MAPRRSRRSASGVDNVHGGADNANDNGARRQPFRPLQPHRASRSPNTVPSKSTPPREIILTPRATPVPLKRKAPSRTKRPATKVKSEPPDIDLSKVRPPSPSDDPLLLSGTRSPPLRARFTPAFSSSPSDPKCVDPPGTLAARLSGRWIGASGRSPDRDAHVLPAFHVPQTGSSAWSDSDDDEFNLTGEYTGKYKILKVPTKAGPPASRTSEHAEPWGRPVSPFPYTQIIERSLPLADLTEDGGGHNDTPDFCEGPEMWEAATEPPPSDVEPSSPPSVLEDLDDDFPVFDVDAESTRVHSLDVPQAILDLDRIVSEEEEEEEEEQIDRELSVAVDDGPNDLRTLSKVEQPILPMEDGSEDEDEDVEGEDIIKITSEDPKAAARAAAILRMHDYDCILAAERKKRSRRSKSTRQRRRTIENAGVSKSYMESKGQPWQTLQVSPGSRSLPLLELWKDAEDSVFLEHHSMSYCDTPFTLSPLKATARPEPLLPPPSGEWTRDCWKCLDKCLVAEQLAVAAARGPGKDLLANMGDISKHAVLDRFVDQLGGETVLASLGSGWSRDELILRLDVLIKKRGSREATFTRLDSTEPRYRGLLQEAMALSETMDQYATSGSVALDATVASERHTGKPTMLPGLVSYIGPDWQTSHQRDPIRTPSGTPDPKPPHPKDQVHLRHASLAQRSMIPVSVRPRRLVDLRHLSPIKGDGERRRPAARRSSGCSVRDLVRQFESLQDR